MTDLCECGAKLRPLQETCKCGRTRSLHNAEQDRRQQRAVHFQCAYTSGGNRCPAPGTKSQQTSGRDRIWYCRDHFDTLGDPRTGDQILERFLHEGPPVAAGHWADVEIAKRMHK